MTVLTEAQSKYVSELQTVVAPIDTLNAPMHTQIAELQTKIAANETDEYRKAKHELNRLVRRVTK